MRKLCTFFSVRASIVRNCARDSFKVTPVESCFDDAYLFPCPNKILTTNQENNVHVVVQLTNQLKSASQAILYSGPPSRCKPLISGTSLHSRELAFLQSLRYCFGFQNFIVSFNSFHPSVERIRSHFFSQL